ncbi:TIGR02234 family membrane protein [Corynebacterium sp.]|uniref:TIGR02234 family membrane protein n=1 Tax=Corynebacterium sp. TaxID=1720 RepID=UPI0025B9EC3C|nr:TIGR02234 family membrane protein [Corynebacterium sp.]
MKRLGGRSLALLLTVLGAAGLWGAGQMTWLTVTVDDDKSGETVKNIIGSVWDAAGTPLALAMLAAMILSMALQPLARRILGGVSALLAALAGVAAVNLLAGEPDLSRAQALLVSGAGTQRESDPVQISEWATVLDGQVHAAPVVLFLASAALGVVGGVLLAMKPGPARSGHSRYETPEARRDGVEKDLDDNPGSGRVMWDALDAGVDPTDRGADGSDTDEGERRV